MASAGALFPTGVAPITAMQLSIASELKLKVRMLLWWWYVALLEGSTQRTTWGTYERLEKILYSRAENRKFGKCGE